MSHITVVVGGQYGSEAKGATVGKLASEYDEYDCVVRVAGPNAGHTAYDKAGREWKLRAVPVAAVTSATCPLHIAAGSEIDMTVLANEMAQLDEAGHHATARLTIHPAATILEQRHIDREQGDGIIGRIGSTGKGIGAARADRIMRVASTASDVEWMRPYLSSDGPFPMYEHNRVIVEGTQGYGLGLHHRNYPQVTSSDCRALDFLAMAGISPWHPTVDSFQVLVVARCYPIRVAGNSGPLQGETSWAALDLPDERTTVTNKIRRVGTWDSALVSEAILANGGGEWSPQVQLVLTMVDQLFSENTGKTHRADLSPRLMEWIERIEETHETAVRYVGTSPTTMIDMGK